MLKKSVCIVSCVYPPEPVVSARTSKELAYYLSSKGHDVSVICPMPSRNVDQASKEAFKSTSENSDTNVLTHRTFSVESKTSTLISRFIENISFGLSSALKLLLIKKPDVIYSNTWPVFATGLIFLVARLRSIPVVVSIQDVYPESLLIQGRVTNKSYVYRVLRRLDLIISRSANAIIVISEKLREKFLTSRQLNKEKVHVVPNWVKAENNDLTALKNEAKSKLGIPEEGFVFFFGGNIGTAANVEILVSAFAKLQESNVYLVIAGDGTSVPSCKRLIEKLKVKNIIFRTPWPMHETNEMLSVADVYLLPTLGEQANVSVPSKMLSYMMASRPILAIAPHESELASVINSSGCGWYVESGNVEKLTDAMKEIIGADGLDVSGDAGRKYALEHFGSENCLERVAQIIEAA